MKIISLVLLIICLAVIPMHAQTPITQTVDPLETGWNVSITGGYSNVSNVSTNNGFFSSIAVRVAQHWNARADVFVLSNPAVTLALAGPEYRLSVNHVFKNLSGRYPIINNMELFGNIKLGTGRYTDPAQGTHSKLAYGAGLGFDVRVSDTITVRPLDVSYVRSQIVNGGVVLGNHMQLESGLGVRF